MLLSLGERFTVFAKYILLSLNLCTFGEHGSAKEFWRSRAIFLCRNR